MLLPTTGTVLDISRTLTDKKIVAELSMQSLRAQQTARQIFHTLEALTITYVSSTGW